MHRLNPFFLPLILVFLLMGGLAPSKLAAQEDPADSMYIVYDTAHQWSQRYHGWIDSNLDTRGFMEVPASFTFAETAINEMLAPEVVTGIRAYFGMGQSDGTNFLKLMLVSVVGDVSAGNYGRDSVALGVYTFSEQRTWTKGYIDTLLTDNAQQFLQNNYSRVYLDTVNDQLQPRGRSLANDNGANGGGEYEMPADTAEWWATRFDSLYRPGLANFPIGGDTLSWPCAYLFTKEKMVTGLDYDEAEDQFNNPLRINIGINPMHEITLYLTLANQTGNGDIFNDDPVAVFSKMLDFGNPCPPNCPSKYLFDCK